MYIHTHTHTHSTLHIGLKAPEETDAVIFVSYVVTNASWSSAYDVRVFTKDKSMKVCPLDPLDIVMIAVSPL